MMERYKNKWFRLTLERDLKTQDLGVNIHCKEDGIYIPLFKGTGVWAGVSIIYYYVHKNINILNFKQKEDLHIH